MREEGEERGSWLINGVVAEGVVVLVEGEEGAMVVEPITITIVVVLPHQQRKAVDPPAQWWLAKKHSALSSICFTSCIWMGPLQLKKMAPWRARVTP